MAQVEQGSHGGSVMTPDESAVYVTVRNHGHAAEALLAASSAVASRGELHRTVVQGGTTVMQRQAQLVIPAGGSLEMHPGGVHIMLLGLTQALQPGDTVSVLLTFEHAGTLAVDAQVK
jgi:copper(I)-binding protein